MKKNQQKKGFTLIEILITAMILVILSTLVFVVYDKSKVKARNAKRATDLDDLVSAASLYYQNEGAAPLNVANIVGVSSSFCNVGIEYTDTTDPGVCFGEVKTAGYIPDLPLGPQGKCSSKNSPREECYTYYSYGGYIVMTTMMEPSKFGPFAEGWHCSPGHPAGYVPTATDKYYCVGFYK